MGVRGGADYKLLLCLGFLFLGEGKGKEEGGRGGVYVLKGHGMSETKCIVCIKRQSVTIIVSINN